MIAKLFTWRSLVDVVLILLLLLTFCSCARNGDDKMKYSISDTSRTLHTLITNTYTQEQLDEIEKISADFEVLNKKYPAQCVRKDETLYRVVYASENKLLILNYDMKGAIVLHKQVSPKVEKKDLDQVKIGISVEDVQAIDETGEFYFLYTGNTDTPKISTHYTTDGYLFRIYYDDSWNVLGVDVSII